MLHSKPSRIRRLHKFPVFVFFLMAGMMACDKAEEVLNPDPNEPNDSRDKATALTMEKTVEAYVSEGDNDWYMFTPGNVDSYDITLIELKNHSDDLELNVEMTDKDGNTLGETHSDAGADLSIHFANPGGTYYLNITSYYGQSKGSYSLKVSDTHANDSFEPNERKEDAYDLGTLPSTDNAAALVSKNEQDWYKFTTENNGVWDVVNLHFTNKDESMELEMTVYDTEGTMIKSMFGQAGENLDFDLYTQGGTYFVKVNSYYGQSSGAYSFSFQNMHANDDNEPDDDFDHAREIQSLPAENLTGTILVDAANDNNGDYEFFKVVLNVDKKTIWSIKPLAANTELHFKVYGPDKTYLGMIDGSDGETIGGHVNNTGTTQTYFYIQLGGFIGDNGNYTISFTEDEKDSNKSGLSL